MVQAEVKESPGRPGFAWEGCDRVLSLTLAITLLPGVPRGL